MDINRAKKLLLFPEIRMTRTIFTQAAANLFIFNRFSRDILFSSLVSFAFFDSCFFLFVCFMFSEIKNVYSDINLTMRTGE